MKLIIIAAVASMAAASPGLAQAQVGGWNPGAFWRGAPEDPYQRIQFLQSRINSGIADGSLAPQEAARANGQLNGVRQWLQSMHWRSGGALNPAQRARIQARLDQVSRNIRWMRHNGW